MPEASDQQMQHYADERIRVRAEQLQSVLNAIKLDKAQIDDVYARAAGSSAWNDSRNEPPHLLHAGNSVSPDDVLNYNAFITAFIGFMETTQASSWAVLQRSIVRQP